MAEDNNVTGFFQFTRNQFKEETFEDLKDFIDIPLKENSSDFDLTEFNNVNEFDSWRNKQMRFNLNTVFTEYTYGNERNFRSISNGNMIPLETQKLDETEEEQLDRLDAGVPENGILNWSISRIKRVTSEKWSLWNVLYNLLYHLSKEQYYLDNVSNESGSAVFDWLKGLYGNLTGSNSYDSKEHMRDELRKQSVSLASASTNESDGVATKVVD